MRILTETLGKVFTEKLPLIESPFMKTASLYMTVTDSERSTYRVYDTATLQLLTVLPRHMKSVSRERPTAEKYDGGDVQYKQAISGKVIA